MEGARLNTPTPPGGERWRRFGGKGTDDIFNHAKDGVREKRGEKGLARPGGESGKSRFAQKGSWGVFLTHRLLMRSAFAAWGIALLFQIFSSCRMLRSGVSLSVEVSINRRAQRTNESVQLSSADPCPA